MSKKVSKRLVIDTSVARSSGRGDSENTTSISCRAFLSEMKDNTKHQAVMSEAIELEWSNNQSNFARRWLVAMESRSRVFHTEIPTKGKLRHQVEHAAEKKSECDAMLKDMLLIEAAFHTDRIIVSLDETARKPFHRAAEKITALARIAWVNPCISEEMAIPWLKNGAELEKERLLGYSRENRTS